MLIAWLLSGAALLLSTCAHVVALRTSDRSLSKRLAALSTRLEAAEAELDEVRTELVKQMHRERARANVASMRAARKATEPGERGGSSSNGSAGYAMTESEKDEWQRSMNLKLLTGEVKLPGRR